MPDKLPIRFRTPSNVVGAADVDDSLYPLLSTVHWYLSDTRNPRPPRTIIRIHGTGKPKFILLNRLVWVLGALASPQEQALLWKSQTLLWKLIEQTPPVKHSDGNPWNCRLSNLYLLTSTQRSRVVSMTPDASAFPAPTLPQDSSPVWTPRNMTPEDLKAKEAMDNISYAGTSRPSIIIPVSDSTPDVSALDLLTSQEDSSHDSNSNH